MAPKVLYTTRISPAGRAVEITAKILGLELDIKFVDLAKREHLTEEFLKMNPLHTIPVIIDEGVPLYDSHAIIIYLVSKYAKDDKLYPKDLVTQARINAMLHLESGVLFSRIRGLLSPVVYMGCAELPQDKVDGIYDAYNLVEGSLQSDFLVGNTLTLADISCCTSLSLLKTVFPVDAGKCPKLIAYLKRLEQVVPDYHECNTVRAEEAYTFFKLKLEENKKNLAASQ
uniref:glutathione transferase n=1 Tax=Culex pipiens TaxID=7175 RepID=A0A8D8BG34_CULPI